MRSRMPAFSPLSSRKPTPHDAASCTVNNIYVILRTRTEHDENQRRHSAGLLGRNR